MRMTKGLPKGGETTILSTLTQVVGPPADNTNNSSIDRTQDPIGLRQPLDSNKPQPILLSVADENKEGKKQTLL